MSYNPEDRISRKEAALLSRKSEDTVRRAEKKHGLATQINEETKEVTYRAGDLVDIDLLRASDLDRTGTAAEAAEVIKARDEVRNAEKQLENARGSLSNVTVLVDTLTTQLAEKDRQISQLMKVITHLGGAA